MLDSVGKLTNVLSRIFKKSSGLVLDVCEGIAERWWSNALHGDVEVLFVRVKYKLSSMHQ